MKPSRDYLGQLGATVQFEHGICRILYKHHNAVFSQIEPTELKEKFNRAMDNAVTHYTRNLQASGVRMQPRQIEEASFGVVLHALYVYNLWRHTYEQHKNQPLVVGPEELAHPQAHDHCWSYCEKEFGAGYATYAAALIGMSEAAFRKYEEGRRRFFDR
jgi:hypothetical protein